MPRCIVAATNHPSKFQFCRSPALLQDAGLGMVRDGSRWPSAWMHLSDRFSMAPPGDMTFTQGDCSHRFQLDIHRRHWDFAEPYSCLKFSCQPIAFMRFLASESSSTSSSAGSGTGLCTTGSNYKLEVASRDEAPDKEIRTCEFDPPGLTRSGPGFWCPVCRQRSSGVI
ncbi:unnamed protein product, partial [Symbiodinium pilosum]